MNDDSASVVYYDMEFYIEKKTKEQLIITKEKIQKRIAANAHSALNQLEYGKSFDNLCEKTAGDGR